MIELSQVSVRRGGRTLLDAAYLSADAGDYITITGPSGSGKSTLLNVIGGMLRPTSGVAIICGYDLHARRERHGAQRDRIGYMFQRAYLVERLSCVDNVALGLKYTVLGRAERRRRVDNALQTVGLIDRRNDTPTTLSGGERQRLCFARAIARRPQVLLADEPTGNLDDASGLTVIELIEESLAEAAVVVVTHDLRLYSRGHRRFRLIDGRLAEESQTPVTGSYSP